MTIRKELFEAVGARYRDAAMSEKKVILDEFAALTGYHRKPATRVLGTAPCSEQKAPVRYRVCDEAVRQTLIILWEAGDRICGKRLKPLIPVLITAMERHGHLALDPLVRATLLQISAATIDRSLSYTRAQIDGKRRRRTGVGAAILRSIPVRTFAMPIRNQSLVVEALILAQNDLPFAMRGISACQSARCAIVHAYG